MTWSASPSALGSQRSRLQGHRPTLLPTFFLHLIEKIPLGLLIVRRRIGKAQWDRHLRQLFPVPI